MDVLVCVYTHTYIYVYIYKVFGIIGECMFGVSL